MRALDANDTWDLADPPQHCKPIRCKWVYKIQYNVNGSVNLFTFAPVAKITTVRVVLEVAATRRWRLHQMDMTNVVLQGDFEEQVYMVQPPGF